MNRIEQALEWFRSSSKTRQLAFILGMGFTVSLTIYLIIWTTTPRFGVLFSQLNRQDANGIVAQLKEAHIPYQIANQGRDILIEKSFIESTRIRLMGNAEQFPHHVGFELFDKTDFGMTDFSQKINYQRALQGELERTINSLDEIQQARVQLSLPEPHLFQDDTNLPRAAITMHLKHPLSTQQITSIQRLIMASVPHLPLQNVVMVDQNGNGLQSTEEDSSANHFSTKKKVERYLNDKVMQMLYPIFHHQPVMVKIDVTFNYDELQRERISPKHSGIITHEKETHHALSKKSHQSPPTQEVTRETSYQLGREKEQFKRANGTIERLTVSVVLPQSTSKEKMHQIERLVKSVIGYDEKRGDSISVEALIVEPPPIVHPISMPAPQPFLSNTMRLWILSGVGVLGLTAYAFRIRSRMKRRQYLLTELHAWLTENE